MLDHGPQTEFEVFLSSSSFLSAIKIIRLQTQTGN